MVTFSESYRIYDPSLEVIILLIRLKLSRSNQFTLGIEQLVGTTKPPAGSQEDTCLQREKEQLVFELSISQRPMERICCQVPFYSMITRV